MQAISLDSKPCTSNEVNFTRDYNITSERTYPNQRRRKKKHSGSKHQSWCALPCEIWLYIIDILAEEKYDPVAICMLSRTCQTLKGYVQKSVKARTICKPYEDLYASEWHILREKYTLAPRNTRPACRPNSHTFNRTWVVLERPKHLVFRKVMFDFEGRVISAAVHNGILYALVWLYDKTRQGVNLKTFCFKTGSCHRLWDQSSIPLSSKDIRVTLTGKLVIVCTNGQTWHCSVPNL